MKSVFADTSYWIALTNVQDAMHETAKALSLALKPRPILTTESVLIEYSN
jgi:predicted nucleic acid-binding protein